MTEKNLYALFDKPTPQNLEANRRGRLTAEQQSTLERVARNQRTLFAFWGVMILAVVGFMVFFLWQVEGEDGSLSPISFALIGIVALGVILLLVVLSGGDIIFVFPRDDIQNGQVDSVVGRVIWIGNRYRMVSDIRKLRFLTYGRALPPPGDYRFYVLARSGLVIMAETLTLVSQPGDLLLEALARANRFTIHDLETNRTGALSSRQELRLSAALLVWVVLILFSMVGILLAVQGRFFGKAPTTYILMSVVFVFLLLRVGWSAMKLLADLWMGTTAQTEGTVTRHVHHARNTRYYTYQVNGLKFHVPLAAYNALLEGRSYRVYFAPRSKRLVAIEPI